MFAGPAFELLDRHDPRAAVAAMLAMLVWLAGVFGLTYIIGMTG